MSNNLAFHPAIYHLCILSLFLSLSPLLASSRNMKSHLARCREFFSRVRKQSSVRIEGVCKYIRGVHSMDGRCNEVGGERRNYFARLVSAFQFSASGNVHPVYARGSYPMFRRWRTESRLDHTIAIHRARPGGSCCKVCGSALRRNCCNQPLRSNLR